ncbi:MAG: TetR family transcriptional regulator [Nakamurella sp.]
MTTPPIQQNPARSPSRRRNSADSRQALLAAAKDLFDERGFQRTTTRDIGERAGLDPTLITRYFGSKAALYLACVRADFAAEQSAPVDLLAPGRMAELLDRVGRRGPGPIFATALRQHTDAAVDTEARALLVERIIEPLVGRLTKSPTDDPRLAAEIVAAAFIGVAVARHAGAFPELAAATPEAVAEVLTDLMLQMRS